MFPAVVQKENELMLLGFFNKNVTLIGVQVMTSTRQNVNIYNTQHAK